MRTIREIHEEIERLSEERVELWHQLSTEYDPQIREQIRGIDTALDGLWDEQRALRARVRFVVWYLAAGVAAMATQTAVTLAAGSVLDASIPNIGASGAIAGVLGAYAVLLPRARVLTWVGFFVVPIPAVWFLGIWIALQVWSGGLALLAPQAGGGTAFFAHIGGFTYGIATILLVAKRRPTPPSAARFPVY